MKNLLEYFYFFKKFWSILNVKRKKYYVFLIFLMVIAAFSEVLSLGAVLPFITVLVNPEIIFDYKIVSIIANYFNITTQEDIILPITFIFIFLIIISAILKSITIWCNCMLSNATVSDIGLEAFKRTLYQKYIIHVSRNSSEVISAIARKMDTCLVVIDSLLIFLSSIIILIIVLVFFLFTYPILAISSIIFSFLCYFPILFLVQRILNNNSILIADKQNLVLKILSESLGGIREILLHGSQKIFYKNYYNADYSLRYAQGKNRFIGLAPRHFFESIVLLVLILSALFLNNKEENISFYFPVIGILVLGAQRMLPLVQQSYSALSNFAGSYHSIKDTIDLLEQPIVQESTQIESIPITFKKEITIRDLNYGYNAIDSVILKDINLKILKGKKIGIIGKTGAGKSTLLDILMGLLEPSSGEILLDGNKLSIHNIDSWQKSIAHVPQQIFLSDQSFMENIAFGTPNSEIDLEKVKNSAEKAQLKNFIETLKEGYYSRVGERGIQLSGGQLQRIGIARALYRNANILFLDEMTSALDLKTEKNIIDIINNLDQEFTIFLISHRMSLIEICDQIIELDDGRVIFDGNYQNYLDKKSFKP